MQKIISILWAIHEFITSMMAKSWVVENILIAKYKEETENGVEIFDCIYCTILRNIVIWFTLGLVVGFLINKQGISWISY